MPLLNLEAVDDPLAFDSCPEFGGGQASLAPPDQLELTQYARSVNVDIAAKTAVTRRGTEALGAAIVAGARVQGMCWYDTPAFEYLIAACNGSLFKWDENAWSPASVYSVTDAVAAVCFAQLIDKLYIADGTRNLFSWDGSFTADLGTGGAGQPPIGSLVITHTNRLFMAGVAAIPDALYASDLLDGAVWDVTGGTTVGPGMIRIGGGEGDPITGLSTWDDFQLAVFKRNSIYVVRADPSVPMAEWVVTKISDTIGCVSHRSIAVVGNDVWFLSDSGVRSIGRTLATTQREISTALSDPVQDVIERINWSSAHKAAACFWSNRYLLSLPLDGGTEPETVLVFHTVRQAWSGLWTGWAPLCWALSKAAGDERLNFGRVDGTARRWLDYVLRDNEVETTFEDAGAPIATELLTRAMIFNEAICRKSGFHLELEFFGSHALGTVELLLDEETALAVAADTGTGSGPLLLPFLLPQLLPGSGTTRKRWSLQRFPLFRTLQVRVRANANKLAVRAVIASGFVNTMEIES